MSWISVYKLFCNLFLIQFSGKQYKLVVVCSIEKEYKSKIVAALDKYRIPLMSFEAETNVKRFLSERFIVDKLVSGVEPASFVDFSRYFYYRI